MMMSVHGSACRLATSRELIWKLASSCTGQFFRLTEMSHLQLTLSFHQVYLIFLEQMHRHEVGVL